MESISVYDINWIKHKIKNGEYHFSNHGDRERQFENLMISEIEESLLNGMILEKYEDTGRGASSLVVGFTQEGKPVHIVCGKFGNNLVIVTVYVPKPPKYKNPFERN